MSWISSGVVVLALAIAGTVVAAGLGAVYSVYAHYAAQLPDPSAIETEQENFETTKLYDRTGQTVLYELFDPRLGDRVYVTIDQIPQACRDAVVVLEDKTFYTNYGFDPEGLARAFVSNLRGGQIQGGSSITQQLIKNIIIEEQERYRKSYERKIKEIILAVEITRLYPKDQILEWYFNTNHYGNLAYGIEAAAQVYFNKSVSDLSLAECAMLAPIPQFPALNPLDNFEEAKKRQGIALTRMVEEGVITEAEAEAAFAEDLDIKPIQERFDIIAPHFAIYARDELRKMFDDRTIYQGGLKVYTTLDLDLNNEAQRIAAEQIKKLQEGGHNASNACVVAIRPKTGEILAMVGSIDYWDTEHDGNVNVCTADPGRQPGSSFKPFNYMTALQLGLVTPATMIMDVRQAFPDPPNPPYVPENYDRRYHGPVRVRQALARSYNIPAVWVMQKSGVKNVIRNAHRMGITTLDEDYYGLALTLGGGEVKPIDMAYAFSVFANNGVMAGKPRPENEIRPGYRKLDPVAILRVEDKDGNVLYEYRQPHTEQIIDPALAYLMTDILSDNNARAPAFGAHSDLILPDRPVAAKTGTTNNFRDNWTIGYTPQLVVAVWVGNNNNEPMKDVTGLSGAAPIWNQVMQYYHRDKPVETWLRPPGLVDVAVDAVSGLLPTEHSVGPIMEMFLEGTEPKEKDNVHQVFAINKENGKLAVAGCTPPELIEERVYEIYPPVANDWVRANEIPQPPHEYDDSCGGAIAAGPVAILYPRQFEYIHGGVVITGNARLDGFQLYRLEYGSGLNPLEWNQLGGDHFNPVDRGPMEFWDTASLPEGLYTLQLTVLRGDGSFQRHAVPVTVDNTPPQAEILNPPDGRVYQLEEDEYINFQVDASDNFAMDRVEYYMDNRKIGETTVAPYNLRWSLVMSDVLLTEEYVVTTTKPVLNPDGTPAIGPDGQIVPGPVITLTQVTSLTRPLTPEELAAMDNPTRTVKIIGYTQIFSGGMQIISTTTGYTETHLLHAIAYDAAGNKFQTEPIHVAIIHKPEEEEEQPEAAFLLEAEARRAALLPFPADTVQGRDARL
ncbi:MAG: PBP1A family penicillin-binding protein [Caldilineae bacterium]|nr:MAG: PBP1A family penicillin-binding protein [Caldilineae bacterium]